MALMGGIKLALLLALWVFVVDTAAGPGTWFVSMDSPRQAPRVLTEQMLLAFHYRLDKPLSRGSGKLESAKLLHLQENYYG